MSESLSLAVSPATEEPWRKNLGREPHALAGPRSADWWTGRPPTPGVCPGVRANGHIDSLPLPNLSRFTRQDVLDYFDNTWTLTEVLFSSLQGEESLYRPPWHSLRHPMIFYYAHPATLYINKLRVAGLLEQPLHAEYEQLFATGVDEMRWDDMSKNEMEWPAFSDVQAYRRRVYETMRSLIETHPSLAPEQLPVTPDSPAWAFFMGFEHERIHLETSSVLIRELPLHLVQRPAAWPADHPSLRDKRGADEAPALEWIAVEAGEVAAGKPWDWPSFGWDNEYGQRSARVRPFHASRFLVTNAAFAEFVRDGGYLERDWWSEEGWRWRQFRNVKWPTFWVPEGPAGLHEYRLRTVFEMVEMPWALPAEVNYHEARAWCAWRQARDASAIPYRLVTEAEHLRMRDPAWLDAKAGIGRDPVMSGQLQGLDLNLHWGSQWAVDEGARTPRGFHDVLGNVWEWVEDHFNPLPGFKIHRLYDDFSTPCYDGQHQMIMGGSFVSTGDEASVFARFHFRPHFYQHAGFRVARSDDAETPCDAVLLDEGPHGGGSSYESRDMLNRYLLLHFGAPEDQVPFAEGPRDAACFPARCAQFVADTWKQAPTTDGPARALDVGCSVGGATFALAHTFHEVTGMDLSARFIDTAKQLQGDGRVAYDRVDEGDLVTPREAVVADAGARGRVTFRQADACSLPAELRGFDAVLAANLLCRLPSPRALLDRMGGPRGLVRPGGVLVITAPYSWSESFTPREAWLGGFTRDDGSEVRSLDTLREILSPEFDLVETRDMPLVIREHARKFEYIVAQATAWRRRMH